VVALHIVAKQRHNVLLKDWIRKFRRMESVAKSPSQIKISAHIVGWMIFFFLPVLLSPGRDISAYFSEPSLFLSLMLRNLVLAALFYANIFYITPHFFTPKNQSTFLIIISALILLIGSFNFFLHEWLQGGIGDMHRPPGPPPELPPGIDRPFNNGAARRPGPHRLMLASPYFSSVLITALVAAASTLLVLWNNWLTAKANEHERNLQKVAAELSVLKLQISPHFLFNTLNNIRWLVRSKSEMAEPAVLKLSQLLRYILYQTNNELVPLQKEVEHLKDYVSLEQMRLANPESIHLIIKGDAGNHVLVPLLLIPIVENFFKHGEFIHGDASEISIIITDNWVNIKTLNRVQQNKLEESDSGIGFENLKRRLSLHYPDKHKLLYYRDNDYFHVDLIIELK
jgi:hypothetical protein